MMVLNTLTIATIVGIYLCHRYGPDWDFVFGTIFFAGIPFGFLLQEGTAAALSGFVLGGSFLIFFALLPLLFNLYKGELSWESKV